MSKRTIVTLGLLLAGCSPTPYVDYHALSDRPRSDGWIPYQLTDTNVAIGAAGSDKLPIDLSVPTVTCATDGSCAADGKAAHLAAIGSPIPFRGEVLAIEPKSRHFVETQLTPSYADGSLRLKSLDVEIKDHRLEAINTIGTIATGLAGAAMSGGHGIPLNLPITLDLATIKATLGTPQTVPNNGSWKYVARFDDAPPEKQGFLRRTDRASIHGAILSSVCRPMTIVLTSGEDKPAPPSTDPNTATPSNVIQIPLSLTVADPDWLVSVPLPRKGTVSFHPLCGVDVQAGATTVTQTDVLAEAMFKQIDAIRGAIKK